MVAIHLRPELAAWANEQVMRGVATSVEALVAEAVAARKHEAEWLDTLIRGTLDSAEREGWIDGAAILQDLDNGIGELDGRIEDLEAFLMQRDNP
jgi:hypothetical protein